MVAYQRPLRPNNQSPSPIPNIPLTKAVIAHVEENRFALLERLTQELLDLVMANTAVLYAEVEVDKPHALRFAESVSITLAASR